MKKIKTIKYKGFHIDIYPDEFAESPDNWGNNDLFLLAYNKRKFYVTRDEIITKKDIQEFFNGKKINQQKEYFIFPITAYIHSGISLSLNSNIYPFNDYWDSSLIGIILASKKEFKTRSKAKQASENLITLWNIYLAGNIYSYIIRETQDSLGGIYDDSVNFREVCKEAKTDIKNYIQSKIEKHFKKLKAQIINNVPFEKRTILKLP